MELHAPRRYRRPSLRTRTTFHWQRIGRVVLFLIAHVSTGGNDRLLPCSMCPLRLPLTTSPGNKSCRKAAVKHRGILNAVTVKVGALYAQSPVVVMSRLVRVQKLSLIFTTLFARDRRPALRSGMFRWCWKCSDTHYSSLQPHCRSSSRTSGLPQLLLRSLRTICIGIQALGGCRIVAFHRLS